MVRIEIKELATDGQGRLSSATVDAGGEIIVLAGKAFANLISKEVKSFRVSKVDLERARSMKVV